MTTRAPRAAPSAGVPPTTHAAYRPLPPAGAADAGRRASDRDPFDALVARAAARLRAARARTSDAAFDRLVHDAMLDAARFALRWAEESHPPHPRVTEVQP